MEAFAAVVTGLGGADCEPCVDFPLDAIFREALRHPSVAEYSDL